MAKYRIKITTHRNGDETFQPQAREKLFDPWLDIDKLGLADKNRHVSPCDTETEANLYIEKHRMLEARERSKETVNERYNYLK